MKSLPSVSEKNAPLQTCHVLLSYPRFHVIVNKNTAASMFFRSQRTPLVQMWRVCAGVFFSLKLTMLIRMAQSPEHCGSHTIATQ